MTDRTLDALRRRLEKWELQHLRALAAELAARLERLEEDLSRARDDASRAWESAEYWQRNATDMQLELMEIGFTIGLTKEGQIGIGKDEAPAEESFEESLLRWVSRQEAGFSIADVIESLPGLNAGETNYSVVIRIGIALNRLGCTRTNEPGEPAIYHAPPCASGPSRSTDEHDSPQPLPEPLEPIATPLAMQAAQGPAQQPQALSVSLAQAFLNPSALPEIRQSVESPAR